MSKTRTIERRKERERQKSQQQRLFIIIGIVVLAVVAIGLFALTSLPAEAPIPEDINTRYDGIPQTKTDEGFTKLGSPDAPVKVVEYASFDCPHCAEFHETVFPTILDSIKAGEVEFTYVPIYGTGGIANGQGAARAAICAGEQGAFYEFSDLLFNWQTLYVNQAFAGNRITTGADALEISRAQWDQCMASTLPDEVTDAAISAAQNLEGFSGTPTLTVNGTVTAVDLNTVSSAINSAFLSSGGQAVPLVTDDSSEDVTEEAPEEATGEATAEEVVEETPEDSSEEATIEATEAADEPTEEPTAEATDGS